MNKGMKQDPAASSSDQQGKKWAEGMNGDETIYGPARVGGDDVVFKAKAKKFADGSEGTETVVGPARVGADTTEF